MQNGHECKKVTNAKRSCKETSLGGVVHSGVVVSPRYVFAPEGFVSGIQLWGLCVLIIVSANNTKQADLEIFEGGGEGGAVTFFHHSFREGGIALK